MSPPTKFDMQDPSFRRWLVWRHEAIRDLLRDTATGIQQTRNDTFLVVEVLPQDYQDATQTGLDASYLRVLPNVMVKSCCSSLRSCSNDITIGCMGN